jgi:type II secretory pathway predicted ATPase ExeA
MYESFYKLSADPFRLSPDPAFSFEHRCYRKAMTYMLHALQRAEGFVMITGQPGTGKTTLLGDLVHTLRHEQIAITRIASTQLTSNDLLDLVAYSFNLNPEGCSKARLLLQIEHFLKLQHQHGRRTLLIVDEAQGMDEAALEQLRLLTNIMVGNHQLLQVFLVGQEQLRDTVNTVHLEQLQQRIIAATYLEPLDADDTRAYIWHRLRCVEWNNDPLISTEACAMIQRYSHGIPRRINQICSRLFLHGCTEEKHRLGTAEVQMVARELQQEFLLPMDKETILDSLSWPDDQHDETFEEELQTTTVRQENSRQPAAHLPETGIQAHPSTAPKADSGHPTMAGMQASDATPDTGEDNHDASMLHTGNTGTMLGGALIVLILVTSLLLAYRDDGATTQPAPDQGTWNAGQTVIPPLLLSATAEANAMEPANDPGYGYLTIASSRELRRLFESADHSLSPSRMNMGDNDKEVPPDTTTRDEESVQMESAMYEQKSLQESSSALSHVDPESKPRSPSPVTEITAPPSFTREEKIMSYLRKGQRSLERDRLLTPENDSAYRYFQQVLELDPGHSQARNGIDNIAARYAFLASEALDGNDRVKAELYLARGLQVNQNNEDILALHDRMYPPAPPATIQTGQETEGLFTRFRKFFTQEPNRNVESEPWTGEP